MSSSFRRPWFAAIVVVLIVVASFAAMKVDFDNRDGAFLNTIRNDPLALNAFQKLAELTPPDAIVLAWWDYGRAIHEIGKREPVVSYPSSDILNTIASNSNPLHAFEMGLFGTYDASEKIHDVARSFVLPEDEALTIMNKYCVTHVIVFQGKTEQGAFSDLEKFVWMARIAGYNSEDYVKISATVLGHTYVLTSKAGQATMLKLLFDDQFALQHFTKIYENIVAKIFQVNSHACLTSPSIENSPRTYSGVGLVPSAGERSSRNLPGKPVLKMLRFSSTARGSRSLKDYPPFCRC